MSNIVITNKLTETQKQQVCGLVYQGFYKKLSNFWIFEKDIEKGTRVLTDCIKFENGFYAIESDNVLGFIGVKYKDIVFREFSHNTLKSHYKGFSGLWRSWYNKFEGKSKDKDNKDIYIDMIVVDSNSRGKGVARLLIDYVSKIGIEHNLETISLDVVDTNENAHKLYKHIGFEDVRTTNFRGFTDSMGFRKVTNMKKILPK